jgi:hypothetical protein
LKAVVAQFDASELITMREQVAIIKVGIAENSRGFVGASQRL